MANIYSLKSGNASDPTVWSTGAVPAQGDRVLISAGHTVELDGVYTWGDDSTATITINGVSTTRSINVAGTLRHSRSVSTSLTLYGSMAILSGGTHDMGTEASPIPAGVTASLVMNKSASLAANKYKYEGLNGSSVKYWGAPRNRVVQLTAAASAGETTIYVSDATGWNPGDSIVLAQTDVGGMQRQDICTIAAGYTPGSLTVPLTTALQWPHANNCYVGNFSSNVSIGNFNDAYRGIWYCNNGYIDLANTREFGNCSFRELGGSFPNHGFSLYSSANYSATPNNNPYRKIYNVSVYSLVTNGKILQVEGMSCSTPVLLQNILVVGNTNSTQYTAMGNHVRFEDSFCFGCVFGLGGLADVSLKNCTILYSWSNGLATLTSHNNVVDGLVTGGVVSVGTGVLFQNAPAAGSTLFKNCTFGAGVQNNNTAAYAYAQSVDSLAQITAKDCMFAANIVAPTTATLGNFTNESYIFINNKNKDVTLQELYTKAGVYLRDNSTRYRGASSLSIKPNFVGLPATRTQSLPCANGATLQVVGYVRMDSAFYNGGACTFPSVSLSGLGLTPVTFTASDAANGAWQKFDLSITNTSGVDGDFTLTYTVTAQATNAGTVWFDGVPDAPFITKARHYGFLFNEASPTVLVDPYTVAPESTAAAYTGCTINSATKRVTFSAGTISTLAHLYDYGQAYGAADINAAMSWKRAGQQLALEPGWTVVQPAIEGVTWSGGTIELNAPGTISGAYDSCELRFATQGTYDLTQASFSGTINLTNTSGGGVVVIVLPSGISYNNTSPATITVQVAIPQALGQVTGIVPGSRIQVFNVTDGLEIANEIVLTTTYSVGYQEGGLFSAGDEVRVRLAYQSGATAKLPAQYRTVATSSGWAVLADQQDDTVYNYNGIDGDTCTEFTHDFANVLINVTDPDGITNVQRGYAWYISGQMTDDGIRYFHGAMTAEDAVNYRVNANVVNMHIKNQSTQTLLVTGGRLYRTDGAPVAMPGNGPLQMEYGRAYAVETGVSGLTAAESNRLMQAALETTAAAARDNAALAVALSA